jgi:hypothetical protein
LPPPQSLSLSKSAAIQRTKASSRMSRMSIASCLVSLVVAKGAMSTKPSTLPYDPIGPLWIFDP